MDGGAIVIDLDLYTDAFNDGVAYAERRMNTFSTNIQRQNSTLSSSFSKLGKTILAAFSVRAIINFSKECLNLGSDLVEVQNVVDTTFKNSSGIINEWSKNAIEAYGLSELAAKKYNGTMGAMLKSAGITGDALTDMSTTLVGLAGDMASFYNLSTDEAFQKIRAGISGETEPLKALGINLSVANLEAFALSEGIKKTYKEMSYGEQIMLRYKYLLQTTADAQGDFSKTADGWANQTRILQLRFEQLKATLGQGFINILTPLIQKLNILMGYLQNMADAFLAFTTTIFGSQSTTVTTSTTLSDNMANMAVDTTTTADALDRMTASFDQLHKLSGGTDSLSSGVLEGITGSLTTDSEGITGQDGVINKFEDEIEKFMNSNIVKSFKRFWESVKELVVTIGEKVGEALKNVDWESVFDRWAEVLENVTGWIEKLTDKIGDSDTEGLSKALTFLLEHLPEIWAISTAFKAAHTAVNLLAGAGAWAEILTWIGLVVLAVEGLKGLVESTVGLFETSKALGEEFIKDPEGTIKGAKKGAKEYFENTVIGQWLGWGDDETPGGGRGSGGSTRNISYTGGNMPAINSSRSYNTNVTSGDIAMATAMLRDIIATQGSTTGMPNIINEIYLGQDKLENLVTKTITKSNFKTGGIR